MAQYTTLNYLADVAKLIDDIHYKNFHVPSLRHQERVTHYVEGNVTREVGHVFDESDYIDAQPVQEYFTPEFSLRQIETSDELLRLVAINEAFAVALRGKPIPIALLKRALTPEQLREMENSAAEVVEPSEVMYGDGMPSELRTYNKKLNKADLMWARFEATPTHSFRNGKSHRNKTGKLEDRAESLYEEALEHLEEIFGCAQRGDWGVGSLDQLIVWMDRVVDFDAGFDRQIDINAHAIPRVRGSKSRYAEDSGLPKLSKRLKRQYCALNALLAAGCNIAFDVPVVEVQEPTQEQQKILRDKLKALKQTR